MTPTSYEGAVVAIKKARDEHLSCPRDCEHSKQLASQGIVRLGRREDAANVLPITECPWCFTPLCVSVLELDEEARRMVIRCPNRACAFSSRGPGSDGIPTIDGLPLYVVDSDFIQDVPYHGNLATVDKFATLAFKGEAKALFGRVSFRCSICGFLTDSTDHKKKHAELTHKVEGLEPIDLIIQDELHTITDNLGKHLRPVRNRDENSYSIETKSRRNTCARLRRSRRSRHQKSAIFTAKGGLPCSLHGARCRRYVFFRRSGVDTGSPWSNLRRYLRPHVLEVVDLRRGPQSKFWLRRGVCRSRSDWLLLTRI